MNTKQKDIAFLKSALTLDNPFMPSDSFLKWMKEMNEKVHINVNQIPFSEMLKWHFRKDNGSLVHESGKFFSVGGVRIKTNWGMQSAFNSYC